MPSADGCVIDTVVLRYFLLVERVDLLAELLPEPRFLPAAVFDPEDAAGARGALSEISESVRYQEALAADERLGAEDRAAAATNARRLASISEHLRLFEPTTIEAGAEEDHFARLQSRRPTGLALPLGSGEAACVAIGIERQVAVVTDDNDALRVLDHLDHLDPGHRYERIRKLLVRAATEGFVSRAEANATHRAMTAAGFWDATPPFPSKRAR